MSIAELRQKYHQRICQEIIRIKPAAKTGEEYPNFADGSNKSSVKIAWGVVNRLGCSTNYERLTGQTVGGRFEVVTKDFLEQSFELLHHLRPGKWHYATMQTVISGFEQYEHLADLETRISEDKTLATSLGVGYIIKPDIVIGRWSVSDEEVNRFKEIIKETDFVANLTPFRQTNRETPALTLHASISCKWTIRSDRAQNTQTEALNLIRNRKGHTPHIVAVTAEPLPTRIAALALGTGDLDCVYHFALSELKETINQIENEDQLDMLTMMINGRRLRDISDLPFDLAV
jgi:hypothetical protein